jgi:hypothetical protein
VNAALRSAALGEAFAEECLCVYGVVDRFAKLPRLEELPDDVDLQLNGVGPVAAVYSRIHPSQFGDLTPDLREGSQLAIVARRHDEIVRSLARAGTVLPVRLGTLFPDLASMTGLLRDAEHDLAAELERVRGFSEWTFRTVGELPMSEVAPTEPGESGAAYLMGRRDQRRQIARLRDSMITAMSAADEALSVRAASVAGRGLSDHSLSMSRAYLVSAQMLAEFESVAAELAAELERHGFAVKLAGPLPACSFIDVRLERRSHD